MSTDKRKTTSEMQLVAVDKLVPYANNARTHPLQLILREILLASQISLDDMVDVEAMVAKQGLSDILKYALIVVATAPILCVYPFIQRYFIKGVMIGSVKG